MTTANLDDVIFSATLVPHRSLSQRGFLALMALIGGSWFLTGTYFWAVGAWPVLGFFGLDFLGVWLAFKLSYRSGRAYEEVEVSRSALVIRKTAANGRMQEIRFNPLWARLEVVTDPDKGIRRIVVRTRELRVPVGTFLNPDDRESFAKAFGAALATARA